MVGEVEARRVVERQHHRVPCDPRHACITQGGDNRFRREIAKAAKRRAAPLPKGRPPDPKRDKRQLNLL